MYQPNHPYLASMAMRNIKKINEVSRHFRKFQQLALEEELNISRSNMLVR
jgi:hypothetical protein